MSGEERREGGLQCSFETFETFRTFVPIESPEVDFRYIPFSFSSSDSLGFSYKPPSTLLTTRFECVGKDVV